MVDGMRLAPPHDKSGHTWYHPNEVLFNLTKYGFKTMINDDYKVTMSVYCRILSDEEIIASLPHIKFTWPEEVVEIHDKINDNYKSKINRTGNRAIKSNGILARMNSPTFVELTSVLNKSLGLPENWNFLQYPANQVFLFVLPDSNLDCQRWQLPT